MTTNTIRLIYQKPRNKATKAVMKSRTSMPAVMAVSGFIIFASWCARTYTTRYDMLYKKTIIVRNINVNPSILMLIPV
jgi:hypothetical protein